MAIDPWSNPEQQRPAGIPPNAERTRRQQASGQRWGNRYDNQPIFYGGPVSFLPPVTPQMQAGTPAPSSSVAVWALVMGVLGVVVGWCLLGLPCVAAVVLGHVGVSATKDGRRSGRGMAVAGLVLGYVSLAPAIVVFFWAGLGGVAGGGA